ncbi:aminodeoxychorismate synthase component I [Baekduia alba]|uniref:aminodeoxychorismate synthase component I n=1 Tax=Baekduia alba TaxID=2997333 RepID=UPI00233FBCFE|nr:aminodeoxychorismate synthase component I [Baekduia alba]
MPSSPTASIAAEPVRVVRFALDGDVPAAHAGLLVRDDARPFALVGRWAGASAIVGSAPVRIADAQRDDVLALLDEQPVVAGAVPDGFVGGGWFGGLGYGLGRRLEPRLGAAPPAPVGERRPVAMLAYYDHLLRRDADGGWWFEALWAEARADALTARRAELAARVAAGVGGPRPVRTSAWRATPSVAGHARAVQACRERIAEGDLFQANLALRLRADLDGDAVDLLARGVEALAPDRAAWLAGPDGAIASLSPELFLTRHGDVVRSAPIKGTRPRPAEDDDAAEALRAELAASEKDRAENVMIVDLMRNDLGRVCEPGTVAVTALAEVRPHAGVWHLVSEVTGRRRVGVGDGALVAAAFPPGSVTGAPKLAAMDTISTLESVARQAFCGAIGFASPTAGLELSVAIRTFECAEGRAWLDVGGGIVADSDPDAEAAECLAKAHPLLMAIGAELADDVGAAGAPATTIPAPLRLGARPVPRPDAARGVFETILVLDGVAVAVEEHVERLHRAAVELYGVEVPDAVAALVRHTALEQAASCRVRVLLDARGDVGLQVAPLPEPGDGTLRLAPVAAPGGLGDRKWRDRRLIDALDAAVAPALALLVDLDGGVLETTRSNVLAVLDDALVTPPLDGRVLPGVTRAAALDLARALGFAVVERPLALGELAAADAVLTSGALRGLEVVTHLGSQDLPRIPDRVRTLVERFPPLR